MGRLPVSCSHQARTQPQYNLLCSQGGESYMYGIVCTDSGYSMSHVLNTQKLVFEFSYCVEFIIKSFAFDYGNSLKMLLHCLDWTN
jgi:hypothetical protein